MNEKPFFKFRLSFSELDSLDNLLDYIRNPETVTIQTLIARENTEKVKYRLNRFIKNVRMYRQRPGKLYRFRFTYLEALQILRFFLQNPPENFRYEEAFFRNLQASLLEFYGPWLTG